MLSCALIPTKAIALKPMEKKRSLGGKLKKGCGTSLVSAAVVLLLIYNYFPSIWIDQDFRNTALIILGLALLMGTVGWVLDRI